jgi:hypothetical protein
VTRAAATTRTAPRLVAPGTAVLGVGGAVLAAVIALGACSTPTPSIVLALSNKDDQQCPTTDCSMLPLPCRAVMSIKILDRDDPSTIYHSQCTEVGFDTNHTMCSLGGVELEPETAMPVTDLIVEVAVFPASMIPSDPTKGGALQCPQHIKYSGANGFPEESSPAPVLGGRAFYHPGDTSVNVTLGCTDLAMLEQSCATSDLVGVTATVEDFETLSSVPASPAGIASQLRVSVGEPRMLDTGFALRVSDSRALDLVASTSSNSVPIWQRDVDLQFHDFVCVDVVEAVAQTTAVLRCRPMGPGSRVEAAGMWISRTEVQQILSALTPLAPLPLKFPDSGLTIGVVVDQAAIGVPGMVVTSAVGNVRYLTGQNMLSATSTSSTGIFVAPDAPFGTMFSTSGPGRPTVTGIGGNVAGKITVVVLQVGNQQP